MADWLLIGVRFALYIASAALFGLAAFSLYGLRPTDRDNALALRPWLVASAAAALLLSLCSVALMASAMAGTPPWPIDQAAIGMLLTGSAAGTAWKIRMAALILSGLAGMLVARRSLGLVTVALASGVAVATLAWTGHGAMDEGGIGWAHLAADIFHLLAAALWVGALLGLILLVGRPAERADEAHLSLAHQALHGFGTIGTLVVATLVASGLFNAWLLVGIGNAGMLDKTVYGQLLLAKLALFGVMLGLASLNRFRLTPAFERSLAANDHRGALRRLRTSLGIETACVIVILGLVAWLGTLAPPASAM